MTDKLVQSVREQERHRTRHHADRGREPKAEQVRFDQRAADDVAHHETSREDAS